MSKLSRKNQLLFGSLAGAGQIGKFGSLAAGSAATTTDPELIQSLSNYLTGWFGAVLGSNSPAIEDMNALCYLYAYQLCYLFQSGISEWNASTTYYIGSIVNDGLGNIYVSVTDGNLNNAVTDTANWKIPGGVIRTVATTTIATASDDLIRCNNIASTMVVTLPAVASTPFGKEITIKRLSTSTNTVTVQGNGSELIDDSNTFVLAKIKDSLRIKNTGTQWDII